MTRRLVNIITVWALFYSQIASAVTFTTRHDIEIREQGAKSLEVITKLPKGTVITIPDSYFGKDLKGVQKSEVALLNWLKSAGKLKRFVDDNGATKRDYFFPVEVKSSNNPDIAQDLTGEVAIRYLAKNSLGVISTSEETELIKSEGSNLKNEVEDCSDCRIDRQQERVQDANFFKNLKGHLTKIFDEVDEKSAKKIALKSYPGVFIENFNRTCGAKFDVFIKTLRHQATNSGIPPEVILGIMGQESDGKCDVSRKDRKGSSVGLFGISTESSKLSSKELQDPYKNLNEAIRILSNKYKRVNKSKPSSKVQVGLMTEEEKSEWRLALSAYNGGEAHVLQSASDLKSLNKNYGLELKLSDWKTRRAFYFRKHLENNGIKFSNKHRYKRSKKNAIDNLAYVESLFPISGDKGLTDIWSDELNKIKAETTAQKRAEEERKRLEEERRKQIEEQKRQAELERKRLEEEQKKREEEKRRLEEEERKRKEADEQRRKDDIEKRKKLEEEKRLLEEEKRRLEEEQKKAEAEHKRALEEKLKADAEKKRQAELERKRLEEENRLVNEKKQEEDAANKMKNALKDLLAKKEVEKAKRDKAWEEEKKAYQTTVRERLKEYERIKREEEAAKREAERIAEIERQNQELDRLNNTDPDLLVMSSKNVYRTTFLGVARLKYKYRFRNAHPQFPQKCTVYIKSFYNKVNDVDEHTFIIPPRASKSVDGTLSKPWVGQGAKVEKDCEFLKPGAGETRSPATRFEPGRY